MASPSQRPRSWSARSTSVPSASDPGGAAGVLEQHQGEEPLQAGLAGQQVDEQAGQPDGLLAQVGPEVVVTGAGRVALVEHQVDGGGDRAEAVRQLVVRRHPVGDGGQGDLGPGPGQALGHGGLRGDQGPGHLGGREPAEHPEAEGHLGLDGQAGVAAGEHQPEQVVAHHRVGGRVGVGGQHAGGLRFAVRAGHLPADGVDGPAVGDGGEPGARAVGHPVAGPGGEGGHRRLLHRVLGPAQVAQAPHQRGQHRPSLVAHQALEGRGGVGLGGRAHPPIGMMGRTSTAPSQAPGISAARAMASSRSAHSRR